MLMAHPTVLRNLVERYESLRAEAQKRNPARSADDDGVDPLVQRRLQDTVYTLCVSTGTREIGPALAAAREHIERYAYGERETADGTAA